jgi:tetratricopeptide (TPR) repeat protein
METITGSPAPDIARMEEWLRVGDFNSACHNLPCFAARLDECAVDDVERARLAVAVAELYFYLGQTNAGRRALQPLLASSRDGLSVRGQLQFVEYHYAMREFEDAVHEAVRIRSRCESAQDRWGIGESCYYLARCYMRRHDHREVFRCCDRAIENFTAATGADSASVKWRVGQVHLVAGFAGWDAGEFDTARSRLYAARWLLHDTRDPVSAANVDHTIGSILRSRARDTSDLDRALVMLIGARQQYATMNHTVNLARVFTNIGRVHLDKEDFTSAEHDFTLALEVAKQIEGERAQERQIAETCVCLSWLWLQSSTRDLEKAERYARDALKIASGLSSRMEVEARIALGNAQAARGAPLDAQRTLKAALTASKELRITKLRVNLHLSLADLYARTTLRDLRAADHHLREAQNLGTSSPSRYLEEKENAVAAAIEGSREVWLVTREELLEQGRRQIETKLLKWIVETLESSDRSVKAQARLMDLSSAGYLKAKRRLFPERPASSRRRGRRGE